MVYSFHLSFKMQTAIGSSSGSDLIFLYQLTTGTAGSSYAQNAALLAGLGKDVVNRAEKITDLISRGLPIPRVANAEAEQRAQANAEIEQQLLSLEIDTGNDNDEAAFKFISALVSV